MAYCSACGATLPSGANNCARCGVPIVALAVPPSNRTFLKIVLSLIVLFLFVYVLGQISETTTGSNSPRSTASTASGSLNDAEELLSRCGTPFKDDSTAYDSPRPPMVTRFIEYKIRGTHLRFIYIPATGHPGDPPPYRWKLTMIANAKTNRLVSRSEVSRIMPCWSGD
jgi:hypothetical protein